MALFKKKVNPNKIAEPMSDKIMQVINTICLAFLGILVAYPLYFVIVASVSDPDAVNLGKTMLWPKDWQFIGFKKVLTKKDFWVGVYNTIIYMVTGTVLSVFLNMMGAYATSVHFPGKGLIMKFIVITMFISAGMIPMYLLMRSLKLTNTRWAMIIPGLVSVYHMTIARTSIRSNVPQELREAAEIDGCGHFRYFFNVVWPLSGSIIAILVLFVASGKWNAYMGAVLYIKDRDLYPMQMIMRELLILNQVSAEEMQLSPQEAETIHSLQKAADTMKYAMILITTAPIMAFYPFVQKHFIRGMTLGSVKG